MIPWSTPSKLIGGTLADKWVLSPSRDRTYATVFEYVVERGLFRNKTICLAFGHPGEIPPKVLVADLLDATRKKVEARDGCRVIRSVCDENKGYITIKDGRGSSDDVLCVIIVLSARELLTLSIRGPAAYNDTIVEDARSIYEGITVLPG